MECQCVLKPPRGRVSAELSKPVERKGAMCTFIRCSSLDFLHNLVENLTKPRQDTIGLWMKEEEYRNSKNQG